MKHTAIPGKGASSYGAWVPDLPGCVAVGERGEETLALLKEAVDFHIEGLLADGVPLPRPRCDFVQIEVADRR